MRLLRAVFLPGSLAVLLTAAFVVPLPVYLQVPGRLLALAPCIEVAAPAATRVDGEYLLTTIQLLPGSTVDVARGLFDDDVSLVQREEVIPAGVGADAYFDQQRVVFSSSADIAAAVGLRGAGLDVRISGDGVLVAATLPDTPAADVLEQGDLIVAVGGRPVGTDGDLRQRIAENGAGRPLTLTVVSGGTERSVDVTPVDLDGRPVVGVQPQTLHPRVDLPVDVEVSAGTIGGPSAGLMIALTVYDKVQPEVDLAAGRRIAGTGSLDELGTVGPIGGIAQKVRGAAVGGADVFLTPAAQAEAAAAALPRGSTMRVAPVATFDEAVAALRNSAEGPSTAAGPEPPSCAAGPPA